MIWLQASALDVRVAEQIVCQNMDLSIESGQCWGLLGANGSGKTTLLHTLAGLRSPVAGRIRLQGEDIQALTRLQVARLLGLLLQDSSDPFPATVLETALLGRHPHLSRWQSEDERDIQIAGWALARVGLAGLSARVVTTLSGGERRRLALATVLVQQTPLLLLDEPTNHLDPYHQVQLLSLLTAATTASESVPATDPASDPGSGAASARLPQAIMMSLHDINMAARFCTHLILLLPGGQTLSGTCEDLLTAEILECLYGYPMVRLAYDQGMAFLPR